jgi:hypothetical protein
MFKHSLLAFAMVALAFPALADDDENPWSGKANAKFQTRISCSTAWIGAAIASQPTRRSSHRRSAMVAGG